MSKTHKIEESKIKDRDISHKACDQPSASICDEIQKQVVDWASKAETKQEVCNFGSTMAAAVAGSLAFGLRVPGVKKYAVLACGAQSMLAGGLTKPLFRSSLETMVLPKKLRKASFGEDFKQGAIDGLSGAAASVVEKRVGAVLIKHCGRRYLGTNAVGSIAEIGGKKAYQRVIGERIFQNTLKTSMGGGAGMSVYSVPDRFKKDILSSENTSPAERIARFGKDVSSDVVLAILVAGTMSGVGTTLFNGKGLLKQAWGKLTPEDKGLRVAFSHANDLHSNLEGPNSLPRMKTVLEQSRMQAALNNIKHFFFLAGDDQSGHVAYTFSGKGKAEAHAISNLDPDAVALGNHFADGHFGIPGLSNEEAGIQHGFEVIKDVNKVRPKGSPYPVVSSNTDFSAYAEKGFTQLFDDHKILTVKTVSGEEKIGLFALTTDETQVGQIKILDPVEQAKKYVHFFHEHKDGPIKKIGLLAHLGEDVSNEVAREVEGISFIIDGHDHRFEPVEYYIANKANQGWKTMISSAGSNGRWLGNLNVFFNENGMVNPYKTLGRLHSIDARIMPEPGLKRLIKRYLNDNGIQKLKRERYDFKIASPLSMSAIRSQSTVLGRIIAEADYHAIESYYAKHNPALTPDGILVQSGGIRSGIRANLPKPYTRAERFLGDKPFFKYFFDARHDDPRAISRYDLCKVHINAGIFEDEISELMNVPILGKHLKEVAEFGLADLKPASNKSSGSFFKQLLAENMERLEYSNDAGNLFQPFNIRYSFDRNLPPRIPGIEGTGRLVNIEVFDKVRNQFRPVNDNKVYRLPFREHTFTKLFKHGVFGEPSPDNYRAYLDLTEPIPVSQINALQEHLTTRVARNPGDKVIIGRSNFPNPEEYMTDVTPRPIRPALQPGLSLLSYSWLKAMSDRQKLEE